MNKVFFGDCRDTMRDLIPGLSTWDCPEMDPLSGGFPMITFNVPNVAREVAA